MKRVPVSENEMVLAFLKAEIDSARFAPKYKKNLLLLTKDRSLIEKADLSNEEENILRLKLLNKTRGFSSRKWLFKGFPIDVSWFRVNFQNEESLAIKFAHYKDWTKMTGGSRKASDGAKNINFINPGYNHKPNVNGIIVDLKKGKIYPELILAATPNHKNIVIVEGHTRATAYFSLFGKIPENFPVIIGYSEKMGNWTLF